MLLTEDFNGLLQDCGNSSALALELPHSCTKPSISITVLNSLPAQFQLLYLMVYMLNPFEET